MYFIGTYQDMSQISTKYIHAIVVSRSNLKAKEDEKITGITIDDKSENQMRYSS